MSRMPLRFLVILLALGATGALGYYAFRADLAIGASLDAARRSEQAVAGARLSLASLDATMRALVAPGQRTATWTEEAGRQLDRVREQLIALEGPGPEGAAHPLDGALDAVDRLAAVQQRVVEYVDDDQWRLAGDLVFNDARNILAGIDQQVERTGTLERGRHAAALAALRQEQGLQVGAIVGAWLFAAIVLLPVARATRADAPASAAHATFGNLESDAPPEIAAAASAPPTAATASDAVDLDRVAALCADLARVTDSREIEALLARAAAALNASGVIVWVADAGGTALFPVASHGYDARIVARLGSIPRDATNLTAAALRDGALHTSPARESTAAAIAAPLTGPGGVGGVLSVELSHGVDLAPAAGHLSTIVAAQLATLVGARADAVADEAPPAQQAL